MGNAKGAQPFLKTVIGTPSVPQAGLDLSFIRAFCTVAVPTLWNLNEPSLEDCLRLWPALGESCFGIT